MSSIDQHSALQSTVQSLDTDQALVDNRNEIDHLNFLARFSSLLNYYDTSNKVKGEWSSFLLKDPVFLLAHIAKTDFDEYHKNFKRLISGLRKEASKPKAEVKKSPRIQTSIAELLKLIFDVYSLLVRWSFFMERYPREYLLKKFVLSKVKNQYSPILWAFVSFRDHLYNRSWLKKPDPYRYYTFEKTNQYYWNTTKGLTPYWVLLDLKEEFRNNTALSICKSIEKHGQEVLDFLKQVVLFAMEDYKTQCKENGLYPDTTLLRAFTSLLSPYKNQLNSLGKSHLDFYYDKVLKQQRQDAIPDSAYLSLHLAKEDVYSLPSATSFVGGSYEDGSPILFENAKAVVLNPAKVSDTYTAFKSKVKTLETLSIAKNDKVAEVTKKENGQVQAWQTFGGIENNQVATFGFVLSSPMLLLKEGQRTITLHFSFAGSPEKEFFNELSFYVSTKEAWHPLTYDPKKNLSSKEADECTIQFEMDLKEPAIEPFTKNPDGVTSSWAQLKIEFSKVGSFESPLEIKSISIKVDVEGTSDFVGSNDVGAVDPTKPFLPLGPTPLENSTFYLGSTEVFSKPIEKLTLDYQWNNLPKNFLIYYFEYTLVLLSEFFRKHKSSVSTVSHLKKLLQEAFFFNNNSFKVAFWAGGRREKVSKEDKQEASDFTMWMPFPLRNDHKSSDDSDQCLFSEEDGSGIKLPAAHFKISLHGIKDGFLKIIVKLLDGILGVIDSLINTLERLVTDFFDIMKNFEDFFANLSASSSFTYQQPEKSNPLEGFFDPYIQTKPLKLTEDDASGFIKMKLVAPEVGFGSEIYAKVLSAISTYNGAKMIATNGGKKGDMSLINPANPPFAPKLSSVIGTYTASFTYQFDTTAQAYPMECFYITPFGNYKVYDGTKAAGPFEKSAGNTIGGSSKKVNYLPLHPGFDYDGVLFIPFSEAITSSEINLYFELVSHANPLPDQDLAVHYHYLSEYEWKVGEIPSDTTNGLTCSGILSAVIPSDSSRQSTLMPTSFDWISLGVKGEVESRPKTVYLNSNGLLVTREESENMNLSDPSVPATAITKLKKSVKEIDKINQPFSSFGGRRKETISQKNVRISNRLRTKDRMVAKTDYYRVLLEEFENLFYVKAVNDPIKCQLDIYCVPKVSDAKDSNAFRPFLSQCELGKVRAFSEARSLPSLRISAWNMTPEFVKVSGVFVVEEVGEIGLLSKKIDEKIKAFLSPWLSTGQEATPIDRGVSTSELAEMLLGISGVDRIKSLSLELLSEDGETPEKSLSESQEVQPSEENSLLVPSMFNDITCET